MNFQTRPRSMFRESFAPIILLLSITLYVNTIWRRHVTGAGHIKNENQKLTKLKKIKLRRTRQNKGQVICF